MACKLLPVNRQITIPVWVLYLIPFLIFIVNVVYKSIFLGSREISIDEPFTLFYSQMPLGEIISMLPSENNPPLHFLIMHGWIKLAGIDPFPARILSMVFGSMSAVMIYLVGKQFLSRSTGITAALLFTFSNFNTYLSQEVRVYSLFICLTLISAYLLLQISQSFNRKRFILLILVNILLIYSHFFSFLLLFAEYLFVCLVPAMRKQLMKPFAWMAMILFLSYIPYLFIVINRFLASSSDTWLEPPVFSSLYNLLWKFCNQPVPTVIVIGMLALALGKFFITLKRSHQPLNIVVLFICIWFLVPVLLAFSVSFFIPVFYEKYLSFTAPALYLLVAQVPFSISKNNILGFTLSLILMAGFILTTTPRPNVSSILEKLVKDLHYIRHDGDPVLITPGYFDKNLFYYYDRDLFRDFTRFDERVSRKGFFPIYNIGIPSGTDTMNRTTLFLVEGGSQYIDPEGNIIRMLSKRFDTVEIIEYSHVIKLYRFLQKKSTLN